ncbi:maltokinase N-terminal cap-like domain-containing protein [Microbacterium album]|uniref:Maltokinase n=1 Tax=Microbacterium album TaxID=2053191 RepID=A0A917IDQ9_9MICO|nr:phosphotransferase [Microbacterium album]GGH42492.1 aminoglycoside phosphotransferase [Microbacterium album]
MSALHAGRIDPALLEGYLVRTRWFGGKGRPFRVARVDVVAELPGGEHGPCAAINLVTVRYDDDEGGSELYQVPLSTYDELEERLSFAYVGPAEDDAGQVRHLYDAVHDRDAMALWLNGFVSAEGDGSAESGGVRFRRVLGDRDVKLDPELRSTPLTGEQSNSSVKFDDSAIMKVFRKVTPGVNPDIEIHQELTRGGSDHIAELYGWAEVEVRADTDTDDAGGADDAGGTGVLQLAMLQRFLRTATDGFEMATGSVRTLLAEPELPAGDSGGDFAGEAARLGEALAEVHELLRERFPSERRGADAVAGLSRAMTARLENALRIVPELEEYAAGLRTAFEAVGALSGLDVQRIHGDLHLGQTLRTTGGWKIVDFEGEPGRPFAERALPDSPWRDVAGMLRSFDYAPGVVAMTAPAPPDADDEDSPQADLRLRRGREWSERARGHFLDAYVAALGTDGDGAGDSPDERRLLLDAYVADKAVYEAVYEKRNRPSWIEIPLEALARIGGA